MVGLGSNSTELFLLLELTSRNALRHADHRKYNRRTAAPGKVDAVNRYQSTANTDAMAVLRAVVNYQYDSITFCYI